MFVYKSSNNNISIHDCVEKRYHDIIKSPNDKREYRGLLLTNKMKVLLISDPTTDKSAASLDVNIGFLSDPEHIPGLAHFCEHMLFLGTEKYPEEKEYNVYLSQNGGSSNASTYTDHTTYYFDVHPEKLEGALDRFSQFFIAPLFTEASTERELNAINSEYVKNLANDTWRVSQLENSSASPDHPFTKFGTGNRETLETVPKSLKINVREELLKFHTKFYSANIMALCILGKESLDELEQMAVELFSQVKNKDIELPFWSTNPFNEEHFQTKWYIVPIKDTRHLNIKFPIPYLRDYYKAAPAYYILHLLGHEGKGSLLSYLKAKGWCNLLISDIRFGARGFNFFNIIVDLTKKGIQHIDDIILLVFQYINMLKEHGPVKWIYEEYRDIADINFRFKEKTPPNNYVVTLVKMLNNFPIEEVLVAENLFPLWEPEFIKQIMEDLTPLKVRIYVIAKMYESIATETEKWYGTMFKKEKIPETIINKWMEAGYNSDFKLPIKNDFIPKKFDIKSAEKDSITKFPEIIEDTPLLRLWFKQDDEFLVPKANISIDFSSPLTYLDPLNYNLSRIFVQLFRDALNEYTYAAELAGLKWSINNSKYGITIGICGYDDKQQVLLDKIIDTMINFEVNPERFKVLKESYIRSLKNFETEQPYMHAIYYLVVLLSEQIWTNHEILEATSQLTFERVQQFIPQFFGRVYVECLIHGNVTMSEALQTVKSIESKLTSKIPQIIPLLSEHLLLEREIRLEDGCHFLFEVNNKFHKNSCTEVFYQTDTRSTESRMLLALLVQIISEPCFTTLRTKQQLGYIVFCGIQRHNSVEGLNIIVQSDRHPKCVEQIIDIFLDSMLDVIAKLSDEDFNKYVESLAIKLLQKPKMLISLSVVFWNEIASQQYNFDRSNVEVAYLRTITLEQILTFYKKMRQSNIQRKLAVHVISTVEDDTQPNDTEHSFEYKKIDDITAFKISQSLHPLPKPFKNVPRKGAHFSKL
ncbi:insulin degrading metalloproteinase isoform X2 [Ptiloglossa arizonensis]|uniref:insulin degrading metalloproteinase isoform X2 n=1 Tax=Ptiloglossa arizonensis TaxID=3350558 RepID=UPI003F9F0659